MQRFTPSRLSSAVVPAVVSGGVALAALVWICPAAGATLLTDWAFDQTTQQLTLTLPPEVVPQYRRSEAGDQLVITVPHTELGTVPRAATYDGPIQSIQLLAQGDGIEIVLTLAPGVTLATDPAQWVSVVGEASTRWVFTPLVAQASPPAAPGEATTAPGMIVELPPLPADPNLSWPYTGLGRLSISAANLMRPANLDTFNTLPETLAIDPFNLGLPAVTEQVSVPSLEELDAAVGVAIGSLPAAPDLSQGVPSPAETASPPIQAIDSENDGLAIAVSPPPTTTSPAIPSPAAPVPAAPVPTNPISADPAPAIPSPATPVPAAPATAITTPPPTTSVNPVAQVPDLPAPTDRTVAPAATAPPFLTVPPPAAVAATPSSPSVPSQPPTSGHRLAVPTPPRTPSTGVVIPPSLAAEPIPVAMDPQAVVSFGQPLPDPSFPGADPTWGDRRLAPDTLIAAGSILELRYTGPVTLSLDPGTIHQEMLVLETEVRDPVTNAIVAPAGSQIIGQFKARGDGHQWVSQLLISPDGQRIPFASTSDYVFNSPQVNGGTLALGTGLGALALTLLTGFGGVGLLGGALLGATTVVGTAPQMLVIEPNQVIYAEVMQDIHRAMPIATAPAETQEWGAVPGTWLTP